MQKHVAVTRRSGKSLGVYWTIFAKIFVAATCRKKSNPTEFVQLVAATKFFCRDKFSSQNLLYTRSHLSLRCVAATCCCNYSPDLHTKSDLSPRLVARTHPLVCFDPYALSVTRAHEISYSWFASSCQGGHVGDNTINNFLKKFT